VDELSMRAVAGHNEPSLESLVAHDEFFKTLDGMMVSIVG
jgi:hypothetical protein